MRTLWKMLLGALAVFMALAIVQQRDYFSAVWLGRVVESPQASDEDIAAAVAVVREFLLLIQHYYGTGGDPRFAERIPASAQVRGDLQTDIEYLRRNMRRQELHLQRMEVVETRAHSVDRVDVLTKEYWIHRIFWLDGSGEEAEPPHSQVITCTYRMIRREGEWRVQQWEMIPDPRQSGKSPTP